MSDDEHWTWSADRITRAVSSGEVTSREVTETCLARLEEVNSALLAVVEVDVAGALAAADLADKSVRAGGSLGVLHGVPVVTKVNVDQRGSATTNAVPSFANRMAQHDNPVIANLRDAGAIILGRTNTPAFSWRWFTDNELYGRTLNPWNADVTVGGSSGGSAAAVSAGIVPIAQGSDLAGSIRYPAYACGVLGLRPTQGRIPSFDATSSVDRPPFAQLMGTQGPLTRTVEDMRLALRAMARPHDLDPWSVPVPLELDPTAPCRVAVLRSGPWTESDTSVSAEVDLAAQRLAGAGYETVEAVPPRFGQLMDLFKAALWEAEHGLLQQVRERGDASMQSVGEVMGDLAAEIDSRRYFELFGLRTTIIREWTAFLDDYPLLLMPVSWRRPFPVDFDQRGAGAVLEVIDALLPAFAVNLCGLPALAVPTSIRPDGPAGVQLVAGRFREDRCLTAAEVVIREGADRPVREIPVRLPADETTYPEGSHAAHN